MDGTQMRQAYDDRVSQVLAYVQGRDSALLDYLTNKVKPVFDAACWRSVQAPEWEGSHCISLVS